MIIAGVGWKLDDEERDWELYTLTFLSAQLQCGSWDKGPCHQMESTTTRAIGLAELQ